MLKPLDFHPSKKWRLTESRWICLRSQWHQSSVYDLTMEKPLNSDGTGWQLSTATDTIDWLLPLSSTKILTHWTTIWSAKFARQLAYFARYLLTLLLVRKREEQGLLPRSLLSPSYSSLLYSLLMILVIVSLVFIPFLCISSFPFIFTYFYYIYSKYCLGFSLIHLLSWTVVFILGTL